MCLKLQRWLQKFIIHYVFTFTLSHTSTPHIIFILADDLGWNDVSFHGSDQIPTPNIDALAYSGVILNRHYAQPVCTPSRAALMSGKYPIHTGMHTPLYHSEKNGLPLHEKILPQYLKELGYATHIVGKWHLGFYKREFTPLERGFDSHFGYFTGALSYYDHICEDIIPTGPGIPIFNGHDMKRNYSEAWDVQGQYATDLFTNEAVRLIERHKRNTPLFLYLSHLAVHAGNSGKLLEAPQEEINKLMHITNLNRRTYAAMVSKLDQSVGTILKALELNDMLKNSIVVFVSDNGAPCKGIFSNWGSNYPFRSQKGTLWEGGVRVPAVVWSPLITQSSRVSHELMHISDWLPTLLAAAGYATDKLNVDGIDQWPAISNGLFSPRESLVIDIYPKSHMSAIIIGSFKFIKGATNYPHDSTGVNGYLNLDSIVSKKTPYKLKNVLTSETWSILNKYKNNEPSLERVKMMRTEAVVTCGGDFNHNKTSTMDCDRNPCLFDILTDPCETENLAGRFPLLAKYLEYVLNSYKSELYPEMSFFLDPKSDPDLFNGTWNIWNS